MLMDVSELWGLEAVVRGCNTNSTATEAAAFANMMNNPSSTTLYAPLNFDQDDIFSFPDIFGSINYTADHINELEGLFNKPFCSSTPVLHHQQQVSSPQCIHSSTTTTSTSTPTPREENVPQKVQERQPFSGSAAISSANIIDVTTTYVAKPKRSRKNQQKRIVQRVTEDDLSSDKWAWRKYGQKPIKGSPYPRSYYRCSSLKGCLARKQVERSSTDPSIFIITFTAEHNHAHPTRRNSLAGTTRIKSSMPKEDTSNVEANLPRIKEERSSNIDAAVSPMASNEDHEFAQLGRIKIEEEEQNFEAEKDGEIVMRDIIFSDELFPSLEDFEGRLSDESSNELFPFEDSVP